MVDIEKISKEISKKQNYSMLSKDEVYNYSLKLLKDYTGNNVDKIKREILISLDAVDKTLWDLKEDDEYKNDKKLNNFVEKIKKEGNIKALTIPINDLKELSSTKNGIDEYFQYRKIFRDHNLPESNVIEMLKLSPKLKNKIINNLNESTFDKIIRNNYFKLYEDIDKNSHISEEEKEEFLNIINIKNYSPLYTPYEDDIAKDNFHINTLEELKNIDIIRANKLDELMDSKYSVYDIKREFCNRFMNIDPIILENCLYCAENKEILNKLEDLDLIKQIININIHNKKKMIDIYSRYMYGNKSINLPDNLITYGYIYSTPEEVKELKEEKIDYSKDKFYHEIYFCRECLLDSNQKKRDREIQLEIPIGQLRNNKQISYENVVKDNIYNRNMAYPKMDLRKEEIRPEWIKRDYLTIEAINSNVDIDNPKHFDKEIPICKNYNHLYDSYMYKEYYDKQQQDMKNEDNEIFSTVNDKKSMLNDNTTFGEDDIIV